jgi:hypothetical protein
MSETPHVYFEIQITSIAPSIDECVYVSLPMYVIISVPATHDGICNLITNLSVRQRCHTDRLRARSCYLQLFTKYRFPCKLSGQCFLLDFFLFRGTSPVLPNPPPPTRLIMQFHTTYCRIISKGRYMKHVHDVIDIYTANF